MSTSTYEDLSRSELIEQALIRGEGQLSSTGALAVHYGARTERSPDDRFIVQEPSSAESIDWGEINRPFDAEQFDALWNRAEEYILQRDRFVARLHIGAHPEHYLPFCIHTDTAWQCLFALNQFIESERFNPKAKESWTILATTGLSCDPDRDGTKSDAAVIIHFGQRKVLLAGMPYAGELKKALFSVQNFLLPEKDVLPMHCSANVDAQGRSTLFFGLSGSGKTTLSADPQQRLIGDDAHGWSKGAIFNLEGGCYAKTSGLQREREPLIWDAIRFGAIIENVSLDQQRCADYQDNSYSRNARCSYPLTHVAQRLDDQPCADAPSCIIFLANDATGTLPALSLLSPQAAVFYFLSGYSAGTTTGDDEQGPLPVHFSSCFGALYMPRPAIDYAELLLRRLQEDQSDVYLINNGWHSGQAGYNGQRYPIEVTRALIRAAQSAALPAAATQLLAPLNLRIPCSIPGLDAQYVDPRSGWSSQQAYDSVAGELAERLQQNIRRFDVPESILEAGPQR